MDSCGWTRMRNEDGEGMAGADPAASWQQCYTWCTPYSHSHPHHHPHHPRQYQSSQYQQPGSASAATNASTHYPSSQQHHLQLQNIQTPPLDQQQHFHPIRGQGGLRRAVPYDESEKDRIEGSRKRGGRDDEGRNDVARNGRSGGGRRVRLEKPQDEDRRNKTEGKRSRSIYLKTSGA
ncbi:hypothetical protein ALC56_13363 [Trachymyrmex septentrionalis]|uniref:Uncharacterized protein n=1 Tax=Trachymyrmex septentrionalis TaxID=34720 RepID=A0A195EW59_9HYME|nr:hypothetical protein ALC56_13363 [Trachymyrmex septentrionalis]